MLFFIKVVGETGFEPATLWSQTRCATKLRHSPREGDIARTATMTQAPRAELTETYLSATTTTSKHRVGDFLTSDNAKPARFARTNL